MSIYLNAYYLNLCGALDNLAWAVTYEHKLIDKIQEEGGKGTSRRFCNLFADAFLKALPPTASAVVEILRDHSDWNREVRDLRDPAAHRVPPFFVQSIFDSETRVRYDGMNAEAMDKLRQAIAEGDWDVSRGLAEDAFNLMSQAEGLGKFQPLIVISEASGRQIRWAPSLLQSDQEKFLTVSRAVITQAL